MAQYTYIKNTGKKNVFVAKCHKLNKALVKLASKIFDDEEAVSVINKIMPKNGLLPSSGSGKCANGKKTRRSRERPGKNTCKGEHSMALF